MYLKYKSNADIYLKKNVNIFEYLVGQNWNKWGKWWNTERKEIKLLIYSFIF